MPHPGCLQRRGPSAPGGAATPSVPGSGIWAFIWSVMSEPFFFFSARRRKGMKRKPGTK
jgi:hypothetical protein